MWEKLFLNRLQREAPRWVEQGWITPEGQKAILSELEGRASGTRFLPLAFGILGAVLLGVGVISFFAANWPEIPKLARLVILIGAMWSAFAVAGWLFSPRHGSETGIAKALVLLGVILYGSSIFLIAQTFHIQAHFPNGVLFWSLGALLAVYLIPIQAVAILGLGLTCLWAGLDNTETLLPTPIPHADVVYWPFIVVLGAYAILIEKQNWRLAAWVATFALLVWSVATLINIGEATDTQLFVVLQIGLLLSFLAYMATTQQSSSRDAGTFHSPINKISLISGLGYFYVLTARFVHGIDHTPMHEPDVTTPWIVTTALLAAITAAYLWFRSPNGASPIGRAQAIVGKAVATAAILLVVANVVLWDTSDRGVAVYICFNVLLFVGLIWLIYHGFANSERFTVNVGFAFFAISVLTLYFDTFWRLLDRSFFFMAGGLLLLGGGYVLERQRRRVMQAMTQSHASEVV